MSANTSAAVSAVQSTTRWSIRPAACRDSGGAPSAISTVRTPRRASRKASHVPAIPAPITTTWARVGAALSSATSGLLEELFRYERFLTRGFGSYGRYQRQAGTPPGLAEGPPRLLLDPAERLLPAARAIGPRY